MPRSDIVPRGVLWRRARASYNLSPECLEFLRSRIYFSPDVCVLDLQASEQLKGFMSDVLVNLTHQSRFSWFPDCHKYRVNVFIRVPFIHKKAPWKPLTIRFVEISVKRSVSSPWNIFLGLELFLAKPWLCNKLCQVVMYMVPNTIMMQPLRCTVRHTVFTQAYQCSSCVGCGAGSSSGHCSNQDGVSSSYGGCDACGVWAPRWHRFPYLIKTEASHVNDVTQRNKQTNTKSLFNHLSLWTTAAALTGWITAAVGGLPDLTRRLHVILYWCFMHPVHNKQCVGKSHDHNETVPCNWFPSCREHMLWFPWKAQGLLQRAGWQAQSKGRLLMMTRIAVNSSEYTRYRQQTQFYTPSV